MQISIPEWGELNVSNLVLDYNGTIARDGKVPETVKVLLGKLSEALNIYVLTADTYGSAACETKNLPVHLCTFPNHAASPEKERIVKELGEESCVCIGNGRNDIAMCKLAALAIGVMDVEGMYTGLLPEVDIVVRSMEEALELLLNPKRIIADLRG